MNTFNLKLKIDPKIMHLKSWDLQPTDNSYHK